VGIVDVVSLFGVSSYRSTKTLNLVIELELWNENKIYERLGLDTENIKYFNTEVHKLTIPVLPGRSVALLVEAAALNEKNKLLGYNAAQILVDRISKLVNRGKDEED
jgi:HPr kinase/phosphorylase